MLDVVFEVLPDTSKFLPDQNPDAKILIELGPIAATLVMGIVSYGPEHTAVIYRAIKACGPGKWLSLREYAQVMAFVENLAAYRGVSL